MRYYKFQCSCKKIFYLAEEPFEFNRHMYVCLNCYFEQVTCNNRLTKLSEESFAFIDSWINRFKNKTLGKEIKNKIKLRLVAEMI
jgi:hypothetical protein